LQIGRPGVTGTVNWTPTPTTADDEEERRDLRRRRRQAVISCGKRVVAFFFSHVGLAAMVVAYSILGGFLFQALEAHNEQQVKVCPHSRHVTTRPRIHWVLGICKYTKFFWRCRRLGLVAFLFSAADVCRVSRKKVAPKVFWHFFPNDWEFLVQILHAYYTLLSALEYKSFPINYNFDEAMPY